MQSTYDMSITVAFYDEITEGVSKKQFYSKNWTLCSCEVVKINMVLDTKNIT